MNPRLGALGGPLRGQTFVITERVLRIGRAAENTIQLDDELVSRFEAEVQLRDGQAIATDCRKGN